MAWNFRYAAHLGYVSPDRPLFLESVGSHDAAAHVDFAAEIGFAGIQYAHALSRPRAEQDAVAAAVAHHGMEVSGILYTPIENLFKPLWADTGEANREFLAGELARAFEAAGRLNCRCVIVISGAEPDRPLAPQRAAFVENLTWAADFAEAAGVYLAMEAITSKRRPGLMFDLVGDACDAVRAANRPGVRLMYDTGHVQSMEGDVIRHMEACWDAIELIQLANQPERAELSEGELDFVNVLRAVKRLGYGGLVELEHDWAAPGRDSERRGIEALRRIDAAAASG